MVHGPQNTADNQVIAPLAAFLARNSERDPAPVCIGDCNGDGEVSISELISLLNIALGTATCDVCPSACDLEPISIDVVIAAVNSALNGCNLPL